MTLMWQLQLHGDGAKIAWYKNVDGRGTFGSQHTVNPNAFGASSVFAADIDRDGDIDLVSTASGENTISWYENVDGHGLFGAQQIVSANAQDVQSGIVADINGDGTIDFASAGDTLSWYTLARYDYKLVDGSNAVVHRRCVQPQADHACGQQNVCHPTLDHIVKKFKSSVTRHTEYRATLQCTTQSGACIETSGSGTEPVAIEYLVFDGTKSTVPCLRAFRPAGASGSVTGGAPILFRGVTVQHLHGADAAIVSEASPLTFQHCEFVNMSVHTLIHIQYNDNFRWQDGSIYSMCNPSNVYLPLY